MCSGKLYWILRVNTFANSASPSALQKLNSQPSPTPSATAETSERLKVKPKTKAALPAATRTDPAVAKAKPKWQTLGDEPPAKKHRPTTQVLLALGNDQGSQSYSGQPI